MRKVEFSDTVVKELDRERFEHPHPKVRRRMMAVWLWSQHFNQRDCARICGLSERSVRRYLEGFQRGGLEGLRELRWKGPTRRVEPHAGTLEAEFRKNPPRSVAAAAERIETLTGVHVQPTQPRAFLHSLGMKWRKIAAIPVPPKKTIEDHVAAQRTFLNDTLEPVLAEARAGHRQVFFVDAAHFVFGVFLCSL